MRRDFIALSTLAAMSCSPHDATPPLDAATHSSACSTCHPDHARDHERSRHAQAATGELYRALRDQSAPSTGAFCDRCHRPSVGTSSGLSCESCHRAVGNAGTVNALLRWDTTGPLTSAHRDSVATVGHRTRFHGFIASSELCGTCHEVEGPGAFRETPFTEWQRSPAAQRGETCVSCHGSPSPGRAEPRPMLPAAVDPASPSPLRPRTDHRFIGPDDPAEYAARLLVGAAVVSVERASDSTALVTITSRVAGHSLPTGVRAVRELWLELSARSSTGQSTTLSGALDERQRITSPPDQPLLALHDEISSTLPTEATILRVRALDPGQSTSARFSIPPNTVLVRARLRYRSQSPSLRAALGLNGPGSDAIDIASAELAW